MSVTAETALSRQTEHISKNMLYLVVFLFFAWGFATVLLDTLIPKLKSLFALSYAEAMLTQFSFFLSYFIFSMPAAVVLSRIGYLRSIVLGLAIMSVGSLLLYPAAQGEIYWGFLGALFVMAAGITLLQVAANPLIAVLGPEQTSSSRLTLAQAFNSLGTTIGPLVGAHFILREMGEQSHGAGAMSGAATVIIQTQQPTTLQLPFLGIALVLILVGVLFWGQRHTSVPSAGASTDFQSMRRVLRQPQLAWGAASIFLYVGAEVSIGSLMVNYLMQDSVLGVTAAKAGSLVSLYWGGAMVGRFLGSAVLRRLSPGLVLMTCGLCAALLAIGSASATSTLAGLCIISIGLCNSIMFPTIFSLAIDGLGEDTSTGSGTLCMAIVGGAIVPVLTGIVADNFGLATSLLLPAACYLTIAAYGCSTWDHRASHPLHSGGGHA